MAMVERTEERRGAQHSQSIAVATREEREDKGELSDNLTVGVMDSVSAPHYRLYWERAQGLHGQHDRARETESAQPVLYLQNRDYGGNAFARANPIFSSRARSMCHPGIKVVHLGEEFL